ncbi:MAG TPA: hypothetical protein VFP84_12730, partial [Kofleriaceae bacterium]|nr:hypothetical protein [Kofleriaceae bacterium]
MTARALRVVLIANDGFSAGHVARSLAIARGLRAEAARRGLAVKCVLATTSQATALWKDEPVAVVTMPAPVAAREAGWADAERRRVVRGVVDGVIERVAPDLVVVDTFPVGPHGELRGLHVPAGCKRVLVRRATEDRRAAAPIDLRDVLTAELARYDLRVHAGELGEPAAAVAGDGVRVPPIIFDARPAAPANLRRELGAARQLDHHAAWARLGLPELADQRVMLVAAGGGGDAPAVARAEAIARTLVRLDRAL